MQKHRTIIHLAALILSLSGGANLHAQSLPDLFLKMPQEVCPSLSEYNRLELVDNQRNGKPMMTRNLFSTFSVMDKLTPDYAYLLLSAQSKKEMKLLPMPDSTHIIMVISTVLCDTIPDSSVRFYSTDWKPLRTLDYYSLPPIEGFRHVTIDPSSNQLTVTTTHPLRIRTDGSDQPLPPLTMTNTFRWLTEEHRFVLNETK